MTKFLLVMAAGLMLAVSGNIWASTLDFSDGFESYTNNQPLNGQNGWGADSTLVVAQTNKGYQATKGAAVPVDCTLSNTFSSSAYTNVWSDVFTKPILYMGTNPPALDGNATAMFYVDSNGYIRVAQVLPGATNWVRLDSSVSGAPVTPIVEGQWTRITVHTRYNIPRWSILLDGLLLREFLTNINTAVTDYRKFQVYNGGGATTYVDSVMIGAIDAPPDLAGDYDGDGMRDAWEEANFGTTLSTNTSAGDPDGDGYSNGSESSANTRAFDASSKPSSAAYAVALPYYEPFDSRANGDMNGINGWTATSTNMLVQGAETYLGSAKALQVGSGDAQLTNIVRSLTYTNVYTDFVIKPGRMFWENVTNSIRITTTAAFYIDTNGCLMALNGASWVMLTNYLNGVTTNAEPLTLGTNDWARFVVGNDYNAQSWSLWMSTNATAESNQLLRMVGLNLNFAHAASAYQGITFTNFNSANYPGYLDNVTIMLTKPFVLDSDGDGVSDVYEEDYALTSNTNDLKDTDGDGESDRDEALVGTDATDSNNFLRILSADVVAPGSPNVLLTFDVGHNANYTVYGSTNPNGPFTPVTGFYSGLYGQNTTCIHSNGALQTWYYYATVKGALAPSEELGGEFPFGVATGVVNYAEHMESRQMSNRYFWVSVPLLNQKDLGYNQWFGLQMQRGMMPGAHNVGDAVWVNTGAWVRLDLDTDGWHFYPGGSLVSNLVVDIGRGIRGLRASLAQTAGGRANFFGQRQTNATLSITMSAGWNLMEWPYDKATNYPSGTNYFNFPVTAGGNDLTDSDHFWAIGANGKTYHIRITNSNTWLYADGSANDVTVGAEPTGFYLDGGFMYYNHSTTFTWQPVRP